MLTRNPVNRTQPSLQLSGRKLWCHGGCVDSPPDRIGCRLQRRSQWPTGVNGRRSSAPPEAIFEMRQARAGRSTGQENTVCSWQSSKHSLRKRLHRLN